MNVLQFVILFRSFIARFVFAWLLSIKPFVLAWGWGLEAAYFPSIFLLAIFNIPTFNIPIPYQY